MNPAVIVAITEVPQLPLQISGIPERNVVQQLSTYGSDHSLDERVRQWHMWHGLDLAHVKNAEIGFPTIELKQRVVIAAELLRQCGCARDYLIEYSAQGRTIHHPWLYGEADDAAGDLIVLGSALSSLASAASARRATDTYAVFMR